MNIIKMPVISGIPISFCDPEKELIELNQTNNFNYEAKIAFYFYITVVTG